MERDRLKTKKKWGIILLVWPFAVLILTFLIFALVNWVSGSMSQSSDSFSNPNIFTTIVNVVLFVVGALSVFLSLPSIIVGIVLLANSGEVSRRNDEQEVINVVSGERNGYAIAGMVLGICSIVLFWSLGFVLGVLAIIFSAVSLKRAVGKGMAIAGLVTGIIGTLLSIFIGFAIVLNSYNSIQERAAQSASGSSAVIQQQSQRY